MSTADSGPWAVLGVDTQAGPSEIRKAYLKLLQAHPPDRDPERFEVIRDAYDQLSDPLKSYQTTLTAVDPWKPLTEVIEEDGRKEFKLVGPKFWLEALREGMK